MKNKILYFSSFLLVVLLIILLIVMRNSLLQENFNTDSSSDLSNAIIKSTNTISELNIKLSLVDFISPRKDLKHVPSIDLKNRSTFEAIGDLISVMPQLLANHKYTVSS